MIVDLDKQLYVVDEQTIEHKVISIDLVNKKVKCENDEEYVYGANNLTVIVKN